MATLRPRVFAALASVLVVLATLLVPTASASAAAIGACANTTCPDPTGWAAERWKPHAGYPSHGGTLDGMNCTNYVAWRLLTDGVASTSVSGLGNAVTWGTRAAAKGLTVNKTPAVGAVAQWSSNHVAYVEQVNSNGTIVISESNTWIGSTSNRAWLRHRTVSTSGVTAFIHFRSPVVSSPISVFSPGDFDRDGTSDLLAIRADGILKLYRGDGAGGFRFPMGTQIGNGWAAFKTVLSPGDFSGDKRSDVVAVTKDGKLWLYRGNGAGGWIAGRTQIGTGWSTMRFVVSPGDFSGDGKGDLLAVDAAGQLRLYRGNGASGFISGSRILATGFGNASLVTSVGDANGDRKPDILAVAPDGTMRLYAGNGAGGLLDPVGVVLPTSWSGVTLLAGRGDVSGDQLPDVFALRPGDLLSMHAGDGAGGFAPEGAALSVRW